MISYFYHLLRLFPGIRDSSFVFHVPVALEENPDCVSSSQLVFVDCVMDVISRKRAL